MQLKASLSHRGGVCLKRHRPVPERTAAALVDLLLQGDLDARARVLIEGAAAGSDGLRKALQLALNTPDFHLA